MSRFDRLLEGLRLIYSSCWQPFEEVNLVAPDNSAKATFIRLGATVTNFWVKDKHGQFRDVVLGYDDRVCAFRRETAFNVN